MNIRLIIRPEAEWDIQDAFEWYENQVSGLGSEFIRAVDACLSSIGRNPQAYPKIYRQFRRALIKRFPYSIVYVHEAHAVVVIACLHSKRDLKSWLDRL